MKNYKFIFFDLDRTLWDFEKNSIITFKDIFEKYNLDKICPDFDVFVRTYKVYNEELWSKYRKGEIKKNELRDKRFLLTLNEFGVNDAELARNIGDDYIKISPTKTELFPNTIEVLKYLSEKYTLAIITNGFKEVQYEKLRNCNIEKYFSKIVCSEDVGHQKPHMEIFQYSLSSLNARKKDSIMIGDDFNIDIIGANNYGIDSVLFNPNEFELEIELNSVIQIQSLLQLKTFL